MSNNILKEKKKTHRWWDDDGDGKGWEKGEVSGKFKRKKKVKESLDPVGKEDDDIDNDGDVDKSDSYLKHRRKVRGSAIGKKVTKEGFSNWREDLIEVISEVENSDRKVKERSGIKNNVKINPKLDIGEAVENLGGTLIEMVEIDNFSCVLDELTESEIFFLNEDLIDEVVEEVFSECIEEGYSISQIENILLESLETSTAILNEAKVTYGHDTKIKSDRLEKVKSAVKKVGKAAARGAGYVAGVAVRGAKAVGREFKKGYQRGRGGSTHTSSTDSDSHSTSTSASTSGDSVGSKRPGLFGRIGSALKRGIKGVIAKGARKVARGALGVARRMEKEKPSSVHSKSGTRTSNPRSGIGGGKSVEVAGSGKSDSDTKEPEIKKVSVKDVTPKKSKVGQPGKERALLPPGKEQKGTPVEPKKPEAQTQSAKPKAKKTTIASPSSTSEPGKPRRARRRKGGPSYDEVKAQIDAREASKKSGKKKKTAPSEKDLDDLLKSVRSEEFQIDEKTLTAAEKKKREEIAQSMNLADFERRYPGRGMQVKMATATKMAKKVVEQALELQPKSQPQMQQKEKPLDNAAEKQKYANMKSIQTKQQQIQKQKLNLQKQGKLPLDLH